MLDEKKLLEMPEDDYMNEEQLAFFKSLLEVNRTEIIEHLERTRAELATPEREYDEVDRASSEEENALRLRILDRESKLLPKIDQALERIKDGRYGYCEVTGDPIGLLRLLSRPTATLCIEEKNRQEQLEKGFSDRRA
jgi:DnaK suppressor protein